MRTEKEIRARIAEIEGDERMGYPTATIDLNAPLALIQLEGKSSVQALRWVLEDYANCALSYPSKEKAAT